MLFSKILLFWKKMVSAGNFNRIHPKFSKNEKENRNIIIASSRLDESLAGANLRRMVQTKENTDQVPGAADSLAASICQLC
jgi:hypothetical protein